MSNAMQRSGRALMLKEKRIADLERQLAEKDAEIKRLSAMVCPKIDCQTCNNFSSSCYQARKEAK